jgi:histone H3/H4
VRAKKRTTRAMEDAAEEAAEEDEDEDGDGAEDDERSADEPKRRRHVEAKPQAVPAAEKKEPTLLTSEEEVAAAPIAEVRAQLEVVEDLLDEQDDEADAAERALLRLNNLVEMYQRITGFDHEAPGDTPASMLEAMKFLRSPHDLSRLAPLIEACAAAVAELRKDKDPAAVALRHELDALADIREEQRATELVIDPEDFKALATEILHSYNAETRLNEEALEALQTAVEQFAVELFGDANLIAINGGRTFVAPRDLQLAKHLTSKRQAPLV